MIFGTLGMVSTMARLNLKLRRLVIVAGVAIACLFLVEIHEYCKGTHKEKDGADNQIKKQMIAKLPIENIHAQKNQKTADQIESSKASKLDFTKTQAAVQTKRKTVLRETCERRGVKSHEVPSLYTKRHIYVVDDYKVMYCFVPKVGCSNWKRVLMVLNGEKESVDGLTSEEIHQKAQLRFLYSYTPGQQDYRLRHYRKFFFVRDPFKRALSVYRNKFENVDYYRGNKYFHRFGKQIVRKFKKHASSHDLETGENATWPEFVDYLTHPTERAEVEIDSSIHFSDHWSEMHKICSPCTIDYDAIGKLETVTDDAKYVLQLFQAPGKIQYLSSDNSRPTNSSDSGTFQKYFSQLNNLQLTKLWDLFKLDYELFGYPKPGIVPI